eukprot:6213813-Pleurochrysis_carterae.AAC.1
MARVIHKGHPPLNTRGSCATTRAAIGAKATAAWVAMTTRKGEANTSSALTGSVRASRSVTLADEASEARSDELPPSRANPNMRSPEAWTRKRMRVTDATHNSRTTGAAGARKSEAAKMGRHAALHISQCEGERRVVSGESQLWARP